MRLFLVVVFSLFALPLLAQESPYTFEGKTLKSSAGDVALPCAPTAFTIEGKWMIANCDQNLLLIDLTGKKPKPTVLKKDVKFVKVGDDTWIESEKGSVPFDESPLVRPELKPVEAKKEPETKPVEKVPEPPELKEVPKEVKPVAKRMEGKVLSVEPGFVTIDFGTEQGLAEGTHIEFFRREVVDLGGGEKVEKVRGISVGLVDTASSNRAKVKLGLNEIVAEDAFARTTDLPLTKRPVVPRRIGGSWDAQFLVRPLLALSTLGGGAIIDGEVTYRFRSPFSLSLKLLPFGFGIARRGNAVTFAGNVFGTYDTTAFEVGLGLGASKVNTTFGGGTDFVIGDSRPFRTGFSIAQFVRLGSGDGVHLKVINNFVLFEEEFTFGGITAEGFVPLRLFVDNAWLLARGGGGVPGHIIGEIGLKLLARGNGGPGSVYLTTTVGGGLITGEEYSECQGYEVRDGDYFPIFDGNSAPPGADVVDGFCREEYSYGGPLVGFGVMWRL